MKASVEHGDLPAGLLQQVNAAAAAMAPDAGDLQAWYGNYARTHAPRIARDVALVERFATPAERVLDVAVVPPLLLATLAARGRKAAGVDLHPERFASAFAALGLDVSRCDIEREPLPYADATFDLVVFCEIFEHLRIDPIFTLAELLRVLRPGGTLLLSTPNGLSLRHLKAIVVRREPGPPLWPEYEKLRSIGHMGHVREYSVNEVAAFLRKIGFSVDEVIYRGLAARWLARLFHRLFPASRPYFTLVARKPA